MMSDVAFVVFHYPLADLFWVSCKCTCATHIYQNTCEYNFRTHGAILCPISDCPSRSLAFILIHNFSSLLRKHFGSFSVSYPLTCYTPHPVSLLDKSGDDRVRNNPLDTLPYYLLKVNLLQPLMGARTWYLRREYPSQTLCHARHLTP